MPRGAMKYPLPVSPGGVREDLNPITIQGDPRFIPDGAYLSASNWIVRQGVGRPRPGYTLVGAQLAAADRIIGFGFRGSINTTSNLVVHTLTVGYKWDGTTFTAITGTWTASLSTDQCRMVAYPSGGTLWLARANRLNAVDKWDGAAAAFVDAGGSPPRANDLCVANGRILCVNITTATDNFPHRAQWNAFNDIDSWPAGNTAELSDTPGALIACQAFGPLTAGLYKDDAVYLATAQATKAAWQFQFIDRTNGPVSPAALIDHHGVHYWMAKNGAIYSFDGARIRELALGLSTTVLNNFDWDRRLETHGCVLYTPEPELWWWYPVAATSNNDRGVSYNLTTPALSPHTFAHSISASSTWLSQGDATINGLDTFATTINGLDTIYTTIDSMGSESNPTAVIGETTGRVDQFGLATQDRGTAISWDFTHGWKVPAGLGFRMYYDGIVSYWKKTTAALTVTVGLTTTNTLGEQETATDKTFDTSTDSNHQLTYPDVRAQFAKVKHSATSQVAGMEHRGAALMGWKIGMV